MTMTPVLLDGEFVIMETGLTVQESLDLEAQIYVALAEIDYELRSWHAWFYSPSRSVVRNTLDWSYKFGSGFRKGVRDAQIALSSLGAEIHHDRSG